MLAPRNLLIGLLISNVDDGLMGVVFINISIDASKHTTF